MKPVLAPSVFQSNVAASNAKLALFYDWLFFSPEKDSIMNIGVCPRRPRRTSWGSTAVPVPAPAPLTSKESCFDEAQRSCTLSSAWAGARAGGAGGCAVGVGRLQHMRRLLLPPSSRLSAGDRGAGTSASSCSGAGSVGMGAGTHTLSAVHIYDGLACGAGTDSEAGALNSMSPEPAILVMHHSMKPHPAITATLLDFMCRVSATSLSSSGLTEPLRVSPLTSAP